MAVSLYVISVDAADPAALARWWAQVLNYKVIYETEDGGEVAIGADDHIYPGVCFLRVPEGKTVKNRLHFDLAPDDQAAEVARLEALGARRTDVGQGEDVSWVVLADPEGNEFCVLTPKRSLSG